MTNIIKIQPKKKYWCIIKAIDKLQQSEETYLIEDDNPDNIDNLLTKGLEKQSEIFQFNILMGNTYKEEIYL